MTKELEWHKWPDKKSVPSDIPMNELLLVKIETLSNRKYRTATFSKNRSGQTHGVVGDAFIDSRTVLAWASIQHLIDE